MLGPQTNCFIVIFSFIIMIHILVCGLVPGVPSSISGSVCMTKHKNQRKLYNMHKQSLFIQSIYWAIRTGRKLTTITKICLLLVVQGNIFCNIIWVLIRINVIFNLRKRYYPYYYYCCFDYCCLWSSSLLLLWLLLVFYFYFCYYFCVWALRWMNDS